MKHFNLFFFATTIILISSCKMNTTQKGYVEINFSSSSSIEHGDWIEIDGLRFSHINRLDRLDDTPFSLPASYTVVSDDPQYSQLKEPVPGISIAIVLASLIHDINRTYPVDDLEYKYTVLNPSLIHLNGRVFVTRADSLMPAIETSKNYPVQINSNLFD
jgi:hypothetical protein